MNLECPKVPGSRERNKDEAASKGCRSPGAPESPQWPGQGGLSNKINKAAPGYSPPAEQTALSPS